MKKDDLGKPEPLANLAMETKERIRKLTVKAKAYKDFYEVEFGTERSWHGES